LDNEGAEKELGGRIASAEEMMDAIDQGKSPGGAKDEARVLQAAVRPALLSCRQPAGQKGCRHGHR
jgi:hypothetical protein